MPVQINELVVRGVVDEEKGKKEEKSFNTQADEEVIAELSYSLRKQIIDQCADEIISRLKIMNEI